MENQFYLHVNPEEMYRYPSGKVIGPIYCQYGSKFFPEAFWDDFAIVILSWWIEAALRLLEHESDYEELYFMDGPFEISIELGKNSEYLMTWIDEQLHETFSFTINLQNFALQLIKAAEVIIQQCQKEKWDSGDLQSLITDQKLLQGAFSHLKKD